MKNQIYLGQDFLKKLNDFSKKDYKRIIESIGKLTNSDYLYSLKLHSLDRTDCDSTFRSIRVSDDIRIILSQNKNRYIFLYVDHHDKAYLWAEGKYIKENDFNSLAVYDTQSIKKTIDYYDEAYESGYEKPLFENSGLKAKHLENFGLSKEHSELILDIKSEDFLIKFISYLPEEIQEALIDLAIGNKRVDEVINELDKYKDFDLMDNPNSKRRFIEFEKLKSFNLDELIENFDLWKIFLHPNQENLIKGNYLGPTLIEGGPGTGKTVIGMHRAIHLCEKYYPNSNNIYFIVFNRQLVKIVNKKLDELQKVKKTNHNVKVINIDKLYYNLLKKHGLNLGYYNKNKIYKIIDNIYEEKDWELSKSFLIKEFFEIIQYKNITTIDEYLEIFRKGQVNQLHKKTREKIWPFFEKLNKELEEKNIIDFEKRAFILEKLIDEGKLEPFIDSVVIDESQDLSENKLRVLKKLVKTNRNNMFILSDKNQRIYSLYSWKRNTNIHVVGRTYYLSLNYRTTREIKQFADMQFYKNTKKDSYEKEYKSILTGPEPKIIDFNSHKTMYEYIIRIIETYKSVKYNEIAIISSYENLNSLRGVLEYQAIASVNYADMNEVDDLNNKINLLPIDLVKGLEYKIVILMDIPFENPEIEGLSIEDDYLYSQLYQKYECLKYVALTRARDYLFILNTEEE